MNAKPLSSTCSRGYSGNSLHADPTIQALPGRVQPTFSCFSNPLLRLHSTLVARSLPSLFGMPSLVSQLSLASSLLPVIPPCRGCVPTLLKFLQWFPSERRSKLLGMAYQALWATRPPLQPYFLPYLSCLPTVAAASDGSPLPFFLHHNNSFEAHFGSSFTQTNCPRNSGASPLDCEQCDQTLVISLALTPGKELCTE